MKTSRMTIFFKATEYKKLEDKIRKKDDLKALWKRKSDESSCTEENSAEKRGGWNRNRTGRDWPIPFQRVGCVCFFVEDVVEYINGT